MKIRPLLIAHRGDPMHAPENTLMSFESAVSQGACAIEVDVRLTADSRWVVFHDEGLKRIAHVNGRLSEKSWSFVRSLRHTHIPLLSEVLRLCRRRRVKIFVDMKISSNEKSLFRLLHKSGWSRHCAVGISGMKTIERWHTLTSEIPVFWVTGYGSPVTLRRIARAQKMGIHGITAYKRWVTERTVRAVHAAGLELYVWTVKTPQDLRKFIRLGVDGIMSEVWPNPLT